MSGDTLYVLGGCAAVSILVSFLWSSMRQRLLAKETGFLDSDFIGKEREETAKIPGTVVICGGSVGGLFAARMCHDHFERVVIVESESWLDSEDAKKLRSWTQENTRSRIMQYGAIHGIQPIMLNSMSAMYNNFEVECKASDIAVATAFGRFNFFGHVMKAPYSMYRDGLPKTLWVSRRALETLTRRLTLNRKVYPNIQQIIGTVTGVSRDEKRIDRLNKVSVRTREGETLDLNATFVIDCTGPTQAGAKWIQRAGFNKDDLSALRVTFDPKMHYVTFELHITEELGPRLPIPGGFENIGGSIIVLSPDNSKDHRYLAAVKNEGRSIYLCCGSWGVDDLPRDMDGVMQHARSIKAEKNSTDWVFDLISMLAEVPQEHCVVSVAHVGPSYWTHYEKATDLPSNWVAIGDSVCRINPLYGQGIAKTMLGVLSLNTLLHKQRYLADLPRNIVKDFFTAQADKIETLWTNAKIADYAQSTTIPSEGESLDDGKFLRWYSKQLQKLVEHDEYASAILLRSLTMMDVVSIDFLHPRLLAKVFWQYLTTSQ